MAHIMLSADDWQAIRLTLVVSSEALAGALPVGMLVAVLLARSRFSGRFLLDAIVYLPMALPPVVVGFLLLELFGVHGPLGAILLRWFGLRLAFTTPGAALACGVMILPLIVRSTRLSLEAIDPRLLLAAQGLGAGRLDRFMTITAPLALPGILVGAIAAFAASLGEFGAVITFAANIPGQTRTLPLAIYSALQSPDGDGAAARLCAVSLGLAVAGVAAAEALGHRLRMRGGR